LSSDETGNTGKTKATKQEVGFLTTTQKPKKRGGGKHAIERNGKEKREKGFAASGPGRKDKKEKVREERMTMAGASGCPLATQKAASNKKHGAQEYQRGWGNKRGGDVK